MPPEILVEDQLEVQQPTLTSLSAVAHPAASPAVKSLPRENPSGMPKLGYKAQAQKGPNWFTTSFMVLFHVGAVAALFMFTWKALICASFSGSRHQRRHRHVLSPPAYASRLQDVPKWVEYFMAVCANHGA